MQEAHGEKLKELDAIAWRWCGDYIMAAVYFAVEHNLHGKKAQFEYPKKAILQEKEEKEKSTDEGRASVERLNFEMRNQMLKKMGLPLPPR